MEHIERYEEGVADARRAFSDDPAVRLIQDPAIGADRLEAFFIHYCALGVGMTEPVEGWIRRAGEACTRAGAETLGVALQKHARAEADHHLLMIADLKRLCARREAAGRPSFDADALLELDWPASTHRYRAMHEEVIAGPEPWAQIGVENEIEMLSVEIGPGLLANARALLGDDVLEDLSFLTDHVELDAGHTKFNRRQMAKFLDERPEALDALVRAGTAALDAYREFLGDCVALAGSQPAASR
jgi:hypothetical protein